MSSIRSLARHLRRCASSGDEPNIAAADAKLWFLALGHLIATNSLGVAAFAAPLLCKAFPASTYFNRTALLLTNLPPLVEDKSFANFVDNEEREVQIVPYPGAQTVIFAFTGRYGGLGMPLPILHRWFGCIAAHVVYLRDLTDRWYVEGISTLSDHRAGTIRSLAKIAGDLGAARIACYGNSSGGYGALLYALELGAVAVLAFGAVTELSPEMIATRIGKKKSAVPLPALSWAYQAAGVTPRVRLIFGAMNEEDAAMAHRFEGLRDVILDSIPGCLHHDSAARVVELGRMGGLLNELVLGNPAS